MDALRPFNIPPGDYVMPRAADTAAMRSEAFAEKVDRGPIAFISVLPKSSMSNMGPQLAQWFGYCVVVGGIAAYVGGRMLSPGAGYLEVFRLTGTVAFACYAMSLPQRSIWFKQNWPSTARSMIDGLVYACLTGGAFGWLWPG